MPAYLEGRDRESDHSGSAFKPGQSCTSLRQWVGENPHWSRWRLSRELATRWDWRNGAGVLKDMAARTLLVKLAQRGLIELAGAAAGADQSDALRGAAGDH